MIVKTVFGETADGRQVDLYKLTNSSKTAVDIITECKNDFCDGLAKPKWFWIRWPALIALIVAIAVFGCYGEGFDSAAFVYTQF